MNIVLGQENLSQLTDRYIVLPLDIFQIPGQIDPVPSYCVVETASIADLQQLETLRQLHCKLIENYQKRNWSFCEQALEHLTGRWNGELDTFYQDLAQRVFVLKEQDPNEDWSPIINR